MSGGQGFPGPSPTEVPSPSLLPVSWVTSFPVHLPAPPPQPGLHTSLTCKRWRPSCFFPVPPCPQPVLGLSLLSCPSAAEHCRALLSTGVYALSCAPQRTQESWCQGWGIRVEIPNQILFPSQGTQHLDLANKTLHTPNTTELFLQGLLMHS